MAVVRYGCKKIELGTFSEVDGSTSAFAEIPVYRDTFTMSESEPTVTEHFQQGRNNPRVRKATPSSVEIAFQVMDTDSAELVKHLGGTVTQVNMEDVWNAPKNRGEVVKALRITMEDDSVITVPAFSHYARPNLEITESSIHLIDITGIIRDTGFPAVPDWTWGDAGSLGA